jgi:hypothetical protein
MDNVQKGNNCKMWFLTLKPEHKLHASEYKLLRKEFEPQYSD